MNVFEPANKAHAILEALLYIRFTNSFDERSVQNLLSLEKELQDQLPVAKIHHEISRSLTIDNQTVVDEQDNKVINKGITLERLGPDGKPTWSLRAVDNTLGIHCSDYPTWSDVWSKSHFFIDRVFEKIAQQNIPIMSIGLRYTDQFIWNSPDNYNLSELFIESTEYLNPKAFESKSKWHCHTGWFDSVRENDDLLNQLKIDSVSTEDEQQSFITIVHNSVIKLPEKERLEYRNKISDDYLIDYFSHLRRNNKTVLKSLINEQMTKRIKL